MKSGFRRFILTVVLTVPLFLFFYSDYIIGTLKNGSEQSVERILNEELRDLDTGRDDVFEVHGGLYQYKALDDLRSTIILSGWAFIERENLNPERSVALVFVAPGNFYRVKTTTTNRPDLILRYPNLKIPGERIGFTSDFSPLLFNPGIYRLYIEVIEDEEMRGFLRTNYFFIKDSTGFFKASYTVDELPLQEPRYLPSMYIKGKENETVDYELNHVRNYEVENRDANLLVIYGWANIPGSGENDRKWLSVLLRSTKNEYYQIGAAIVPYSEISPTVPSLLAGEAADSGFFAKVYEDYLPADTYTILLYLYESETRFGIVDTGHTITLNY